MTLTGPGGTGKTRLALQVAADVLDRFEDGAFFVALAPINDSPMVVSAIAQTVGIQEVSGRRLLDSLKDYLRDKRLVFVLDNFEQVLPAGPMVADLLGSCPKVKVLATSRAVLHLRGEREFAVAPLAVPNLTRLPTAEALLRYPSVALFVRRARYVKSNFALSDDDAAAVAEICIRLDGLPLAIELAAARVKLLPPRTMLTRLGRRLTLLTGGARDRPARQQTLRDTIAWSYDLLDQDERALFRRLAVFVGGCGLVAIEAMCPVPECEGLDSLDGMASLLDKSLVRQDEQPDGTPRFTMLETIREFATERLEEVGEAPCFRRRHADHFRTVAERAASMLRGARQTEWMAHLEIEHDNVRAALAWSLAEDGDVETGLLIAGALSWFWYMRAHYSEGRRWLDALLEASDGASDAARATALGGAGLLAREQGDYARATQLLEESLRVCETLGDRRGLAWAYSNLGHAARSRGDFEQAAAFQERSLALAREIGDTWGAAWSLGNRGRVAEFQGDYQRAKTCCEESLHLFRTLGDPWGIGRVLMFLARVADARGHYDRAATLYDEGLGIATSIGDKWNVALALHGLGIIACARGEYVRADGLHRESLAMRIEFADKASIAESIGGLAGVLTFSGLPEKAIRLFGAADSLREAIGTPLLAAERARREHGLDALRAELEEDAFTVAWTKGRAMTLEQAIACALEVPAPL